MSAAWEIALAFSCRPAGRKEVARQHPRRGWVESVAKGHWQRTGRRTFEYTMVSYGLDAFGQPVYIAKNSGWKEMLQGCRSSEIEGAIELYAPDQDPFGDDPPLYGCVGPAFATEMQMYVDPPCEPPPPPNPAP